MKNKENKKYKIMMKKHFTKDQLMTMKKYPRLMSYDIPYAVINRAYNRYINKVDDYICTYGFPKHWFNKSRESFSIAVKVYIVSKEDDYTYRFGTRGYINTEITKLSGIDKYLERRFY